MEDLFSKDDIFKPFSSENGCTSMFDSKIRDQVEKDHNGSANNFGTKNINKFTISSSETKVIVDSTEASDDNSFSESLNLRLEIAKLNDELTRLRSERDYYKKTSRLIARKEYATSKDTAPAAQVLFMNNSFAKQYKHELECYIYDILHRQHNGDQMDAFESKPPAVCLLDPSAAANRQVRLAHTVIGCCQYYCDFILDSIGWPLVNNNPAASDGWNIPLFARDFNKPMPSQDEEETVQTKFSSATCWNCGGAHVLSACQEKRDPKRINEARREFAAQQMEKKQATENRYQIELDPKFSTFKPGILSDNLRKALNLKDDQIPYHVYVMRSVGYPPGWLEEARAQKSTNKMRMFDKHGLEINTVGQQLEEGELDLEEDAVKNNAAVSNLLVSYPGFNVDLPKGCIDECKQLGMPAMQHDQRKSIMQRHLLEPIDRGSIKRPLNDNNRGKKRLKVPDEDMELGNSGDEGENAKEGSPSTLTLEELQERQLRLQLALEEANVLETQGWQVLDSYDDDSDSPTISEQQHPLQSIVPPVDDKESGDVQPSNSVISSDALTCLRMAVTPISGRTTSVACGTPVVESISDETNSIKGVPDAARFAENIGEHLPYETVGESTGTYDRIKGLLQRLREIRNDCN